jgi:hypothetical protein
MDLCPSYRNFCNTPTKKWKFVFHSGKLGTIFRNLPKFSPRKMLCYIRVVVAVCVKMYLRTLATRRLFSRYDTKKILIEVRVVANPPDLRILLLNEWVLYSMAFKRSVFRQKKGSRTLV